MRDYPEKPAMVYYFGACLSDLFYPEAGIAVKKTRSDITRDIFH